MNIKRRRKPKTISREKANGLMVSPCSGCGREYKDKRYRRCATCEEPELYAATYAAAGSRLKNG